MSDLINRDDALHIVDVAEDEHPYKVPGLFVTYSEYNQGWSDAVDFIRSRMEKADAVPTAPRWVRCEERLPSRKNKVIIVDGFGQVDVARLTDEGWQLPYGVIDVGRAKWWMPIEPPKEATDASS